MTYQEARRRYPIRVDEKGCWVWTGLKQKNGYGAVIRGDRRRVAHRLVYNDAIGGCLRPELVLDHLCRNRACVRPDHLEPVTSRENTLRGEGPTARNARKSHCLQGHPFTLANTDRAKDGSRMCRACYLAKRKPRNK